MPNQKKLMTFADANNIHDCIMATSNMVLQFWSIVFDLLWLAAIIILPAMILAMVCLFIYWAVADTINHSEDKNV